MSENEQEKNRIAAEWATRPVYKILILGLVLIEVSGNNIDAGTKQTIHIVMWIGLGIIIIVNIVNFITRFGDRKESRREESDED